MNDAVPSVKPRKRFGCTCRPYRCGRLFKTKRARDEHVARVYAERCS